MPDIVVKWSKIAGRGVFANRNFKKGEKVIQWDISHQLLPYEIKKLPEKIKKYIAFFNGLYILMQTPGKYVNHSCDPNTTTRNFCDVAIRDINKGEEITGNYLENELPGFEMECKCGSKNCQGVIRKSMEQIIDEKNNGGAK